MVGEFLEPNPEEILAIRQVVDYVNDVATKYGGLPISPDRVYILKQFPNKGNWNPVNNAIAVERHESPIVFMHRLVHECFHRASYHAAQVTAGGRMNGYRSGLTMRGRNGEGDFLEKAQEAVISNLSHSFITDVLSRSAEYQEELAAVEEVKQWLLEVNKRLPGLSDEQRADNVWRFKNIFWLPNVHHLVSKIKETDVSDIDKASYIQGYISTELESYNVLRERPNERIAFEKVMTRLVHTTTDGLPATHEEIFDHFARAHFSGNYLPLARRIESLLGKGSFRQIAIELGEMAHEEENKTAP